jgi:hypothetical protein
MCLEGRLCGIYAVAQSHNPGETILRVTLEYCTAAYSDIIVLLI